MQNVLLQHLQLLMLELTLFSYSLRKYRQGRIENSMNNGFIYPVLMPLNIKSMDLKKKLLKQIKYI